MVGAVALIPLLVVPLTWKEQVIVGAVLVFIAILLNTASRSLSVTMLLMTFSVFSTLRYGYWRVMQTWDGITSAGHLYRWDTVVVLALLAAEFFAFSTLILGYFQTLRPLQRPPLELEGARADWPTVDVLVPTYNEPLHVVRATVLAAMAMDYPLRKMRVLLLDDGRRAEFRDFAAQAGVEYIARGNNTHAKAGNINHALEQVHGEYVAIFDSDHVPARSFLRMTLGWFLRDRGLGLVQTPHDFYSPDPFERNLGQFRKVPNEGELFHRLVQDGNDLWNASFFCGSCAVLRRSALDEIGGIAVETVTEDAHTALRMQRRGWGTAFINVPLAAGLATESLAAHIGQRIRWARGMTQILRIENPLIASGLTLSQRLCYFNATTHFLFALPRLIFLTVPLVYLLFGMVNIYGYTWAILAYAAPHLVLSNLTNSRIQGRYRYSFWNEIYEAVLAPYILFPTLLALINPRLGKFNVTSKGGTSRRSYFDLRIALPFLFLLALNVAGLVNAEHRYIADPAHRDTVIMNAAWTAYSTMILCVAASVAWERRRLHLGTRLRPHVSATLRLEGLRQVAGGITELARSGATVKVEEPLELPLGAAVQLEVGDQGSHWRIPALVAHSAGQRQHLFFPDLTPEQRRCLFNQVRSRPSALRSIKRPRPNDRPLTSLLNIFGLAIRGVAILTIAIFAPGPAPSPAPLPARPKRRAAFTALWILTFVGLLFPAQAQVPKRRAGRRQNDGQANAVQPASVTEAANFHDKFELGMAGAAKTLTLNGNGASQNFFFGEPVTKVTTSAILNLLYAAPALRPDEARLELMLNGAEVGSIALTPGVAQAKEFTLPTDLLTGDNTLSFQLQGSCAACGLKHEPAVILDSASTVELSGTKLPMGNDLSLLPLPFFDSAGLRSWSLPVVFGDPPDDATLEAAALAASWFGVLSDVRGVHFPVSVGELPNGNAIVFALRGSSLLDDLSLPAAAGPLLAMRDNPRDPYGKLLIVTGDRPADLLAAARALARGSGMPHAGSLSVSGVAVRPAPAYSAPRWLQTDEPSPIGTYTTSAHLKLQGTGSITLYFRLPPDLFLRAEDSVPLLLKYGYAGVPEGSKAVLHVRLNGKDIDSIELEPALTQVKRSAIFRLPTGSLEAYTNTLTIDFYFERNAPPANVQPSFVIDRDSSLDLRGIPHSVVVPRLELFADAGYPFTEWPDLGRTGVIMPETPSPADYEALLDMTGFFGAQTGALANALAVAGPQQLGSVQDKDLILIGAPDSQPLLTEWASNMPLDLSGPGMRINQGFGSTIQGAASTWLLHPEWPFRNYDYGRLASLLNNGAGIDAIVESFASPLHPDRLAVALVPRGPHAPEALRALFTPSERRGPVYGGVAVSQNGRFASFLVGNFAYHAGQFDQYQYAAVFVLEHYSLIPLAVVLFAIMIVAWVRKKTERVAARRLAMR